MTTILTLATALAAREPSKRDLIDILDRIYHYVDAVPYTKQSASTLWFAALLLRTTATSNELYILSGALKARVEGQTSWADIAQAFTRYQQRIKA